MSEAKRDANQVPTMIGVSSADGITPVVLWADPTTHRLLVDLPSGSGTGTVTSVSIVTANGISGSVATATTTPAITLTLGAITPTTVNGLTLAAAVTGFTIAGGTTPKTLTVSDDADVSGNNTGDQDLSGYVTKATYNAYSILMATTDDTPVAITIAEQTIVGRITGGAIKALSATEVRTLINVADGANAYVHPNHSGDVTSVADGAQTIANSAVTYAKMQNVSDTAKVLGRKTAGAGVVEELDIDTDLSSVSANDDSVPSAKATKAMGDLKLPLAGGTMTGKIVNAGTTEVGKTYTPATGAQVVELDCAVNNIHVVSGHADGTAITFTIANATSSQPFIVSILQGAVVSTISAWFATIRWAGGSAPTLTATVNKRDTFGFIRTGTDTYDGFIIGQNC